VRKYPCSTSDVPGLYEAFGLPEFNDLYLKYENNKNISRKVVVKIYFYHLLRMNTGRIYIQNLDNANAQSPFKIRFL
jgi:ribonucleoside-diphosphate reductase alpha chain